MRRSFSFALAGGLDEATQPLALPAGRVITCLNHEVLEAGYGLIDGHERFDGRVGPTDYPFWMLPFDNGATAIEAGDTITGATSAATGIVVADVIAQAGDWDGSAAGVIGLRDVSGTFDANENILVSASPVAQVVSAQYVGAPLTGDDIEEACSAAVRDYAREQIDPLPGSGPVRGVWEFGEDVYGFRDNAGATACVMHRSTPAGWEEVDIGHNVAFVSGGTVEITSGSTITGATSGATATVERVNLATGTWAGGTAAGTLILWGITGTFTPNENLNIGVSLNVATLGPVAVAPNTLPPGGRYFFVAHNFYGASDRRRFYAVNGVGNGFEFTGDTIVPIVTGMDVDTPNRVAVFRNQLFFAYPGGSVQHSAPGEPLNWNPILGAAEIAIGSDVADFITNVDSLIILGLHGIYSLTGYGVADWVLGTLTQEAGAKPFTGQRIGQGLYLDNRGLRSLAATQSFGNFAMGTITETVKKTMRRKQEQGITPVASVIVRSKNHYRLIYSDGSGLSFYLGRKVPEPMYFEIGKVVTCVSSNESAEGTERVFFGSTDGFVYQLDKGTSHDGSNIEAYLQLAYSSMGSPNILKRVLKVSMEIAATGGSQIGIAVDFDYSLNEQMAASQATAEARGSGGIYGLSNWAEFNWSAPIEDVVETEVEGQGRNASIIAFSNSDVTPAYALRGATLYYSDRGAIR